MFEILDNKIFMDPVHGYISIPKCFVKHIIDTEMFQRLRNIDQTGMCVLYPDAKHDRFGHSLGVYYLGCKAVDALLENFSNDIHWRIRSDNKMLIFWAENKILFMLACLLHDIGHVPFSHSLENQMLKNSHSEYDLYEFEKKLARMINALENDNTETVQAEEITKAPHEQLGAMYILENMRTNIEKVYDELIAADYPNVKSADILYAENYDGRVVLSKSNLEQDICFIVRMILGLKYKDYTPEKQIRNCFIELLNSNNFDVDKLDYIIRDTQMSGIANINIDVERLLGAISIVTKTVFKNQKKFKKKYSDITIYELDYSDVQTKEKNSIRLIGKLKGTVFIFPGAEVQIRQGSKFESFCADKSVGKIVACENSSPMISFSEETEIYQDGERQNKQDGQTPLSYNNKAPYQCSIKNATIVKNDFIFRVFEESSFILKLDGKCDILIKGNDSICSIKVVVADGPVELEGTFDKLVMLGDCLQDSMPTADMYHEFNVGYKKQAMNVIANVLEARDYLYLWVYAHHKVIYYANYLIPCLAKSTFNEKGSEALPWELKYSNILNLDDYYVWTAIKMYAQRDIPEEDQRLCRELFSREYKKSAYKSLAEFDLIFENFTEQDKMDIKSHLQDNLNVLLPYLESDNEKTAGYLSTDFLKEMKIFARNNNLIRITDIKKLVFVAAAYESKPINPHNILILMGNRVIAMEEIPLLKRRYPLMSQNTSHYFYLYYEIENNSLQDDVAITEEIKQLLRIYFTDYIEKKNMVNQGKK